MWDAGSRDGITTHYRAEPGGLSRRSVGGTNLWYNVTVLPNYELDLRLSIIPLTFSISSSKRHQGHQLNLRVPIVNIPWY